MFYIKHHFEPDELDTWCEFIAGRAQQITVTDEDRNVVLITHGGPDGSVSCTLSASELMRVDKVYCCYPAAVKARYPGLPIQGDWNTRSAISLLTSVEKSGLYARQAPQ